MSRDAGSRAPGGGPGAPVLLAYAEEAAHDPTLLRGYRDAFARQPRATLVLYAPDQDEADAHALVAPAVAGAGLDGDDGPEVVLLCVRGEEGDLALRDQAHAVLTRFPPGASFTTVPHVVPEELPALLPAAPAEDAPRPSEGLRPALLSAVLARAAGPSIAGNVDEVRFPHGQPALSPAESAARLASLLDAAGPLDRLHARLDRRSAARMVDLLCFRVLGPEKVRLPLGPGSRTARRVRDLRARCLVGEAGSADGLVEERAEYDLEPLGVPLRVHARASTLLRLFVLHQHEHLGPPRIAVEAGDVVLDAGGAGGETSLAFAHAAGPGGRIVSWRSRPQELWALERNLALNPALAERIEVVRPQAAPAGAATIDALVAGGSLPRVDFLKLDLEGGEVDALLGARATLEAFRPRLAIAVRDPGPSLAGLSQAMDELDLGYALALGHFTPHAEETVLFGWRDDARGASA